MDKFKILIIEDNNDNIKTLEEVMKNLDNCYLEYALTGDEALKKLMGRKFDLIMMDLKLPDIHGYELIKLIKRRRKTSHIPVVFITGYYLTEEDKKYGFELGAVDYILKPFDLKELKNKISQYINSFNKIQKLMQKVMISNVELQNQNNELKSIYKKLEKSEGLWKTLGENIPYYILMINKEGEIIFSNKELSNISVDSYEGNIISTLNIEDKHILKRKISKSINNNMLAEFEVKIKDKQQWYILKCIPIEDLDENESTFMIVLRDITKIKLHNKKIEYLTFHDGLTDLYNRNFFENFLINMNALELLPMSIIMLDMNNLKLINDAFGHHKGDQLIIMAGKYLKHLFRKEDIICRWGGDEFLILMLKTDSNTSQKYASKVAEKRFEVKKDFFRPHLAIGLETIESEKETITEAIKIAEDRMYRNKLINSKSYRSSIIESLKYSLLEKDYETEQHTERVENIVTNMAKSLNMNLQDRDSISLLASLHDIGKLAVPEEILIKPSKLTQEEFNIIKRHPQSGYNICKTIPELVSIAESILSHHEWWDGSGYPQGLKGKDIPTLSRILSIADAYDVMTHKRPYKRAMSHEKAVEELKKCSGTQFDPRLVEVFLENYIYNTNQGYIHK